MDDHSKHCYMRQTVCTCGYENEREAAIAAKDAEIEKLKAALAESRSVAIEDTLAALTAHELYQYRPKAFEGFIAYARSALKGDAA